MKRFCTKFYIAFALFAALYLTFVFCKAFLYTGDLGVLGAVPFGPSAKGTHIGEQDSLVFYQDVTSKNEFDGKDVIVIGDSFSMIGDDGFPNYLGQQLGRTVKVIERDDFYEPVKDFIGLANEGFFVPGQIVVLETVERTCVHRLLNMNLEQSALFQAPDKEPMSHKKSGRYSFSRFVSWLRLNIVHSSNPVKECHLTKDMFSHKRYSNVLWYYFEDLLYESRSEEEYLKSVDNLEKLYLFAQEKGINLIFLIATDKFDCYEPWVVEEHLKNPISDFFKDIPFVFDTKCILQEAVSEGRKDVYMVSDSHWSNIGAGIVGEALAEKITEYGSREDVLLLVGLE